MAFLHWRKFVFFDEEYVTETELNLLVTKEVTETVSDVNQSLVTVELSCSSSGRETILLGDTKGYVHIVNKHLKISSFRANQKFTSHVKQVLRSPVFVTCGSDQEGVNPIIKLWNPEMTDRLNQPICIRVIRANSGFISPTKVTCIECNDNLTLMIVGYEDGTLILFHGDVTKQRISRKSGPIKMSEFPITGIFIRENSRISDANSLTSAYISQYVTSNDTTAFISTQSEIYYANLSERSFSKELLDQVGCRPKCCCLLPDTDGQSANENLFAAGRDNAVYFYQIDGRGPCLAFEGEKLLLHRFKSYLVIVSRDLPSKNDTNIMGSRISQSNDSLGSDTCPKKVNLNIYDIKNKFIAYSSTIPEIQEMVSDWGQLLVICKSGKVILFREKDTQTKLETLFRKIQFSLVIDIAKSHQYDEDALTDIFKQAVKLLEQLVDSGTDFATKAVYNLLLELYLNAWRKEKDDLLRNTHADKIKKLLSQSCDKFDLDQALILCRNNRFDEGLVDLYARAKLYHLVLQYYIDQDDSLKIIKTCEDHGNEDPKLYMPALIHYSKTGDERLSQLLKAIEHQKIIPPMVVIKILLDSKRATLNSVKEYLVRFLSKLQDKYVDNENAIDHYKDDTEVVRQKIEEFENHQTVFQTSKCSTCQGTLDLPSVHFLCSHSYHQNCFYSYSAENDECPICVTANRKLLDEIDSHEASKSSLKKLERQITMQSDDIFNSLARLFGYGLFN